GGSLPEKLRAAGVGRFLPTARHFGSWRCTRVYGPGADVRFTLRTEHAPAAGCFVRHGRDRSNKQTFCQRLSRTNGEPLPQSVSHRPEWQRRPQLPDARPPAVAAAVVQPADERADSTDERADAGHRGAESVLIRAGLDSDDA